MKKNIVSLAVGSAFAATMLAPAAHAAGNPFDGAKLDAGYQVAQADTKTPDAKCGADKKKDGKCGGDKSKDGKCGADKSKDGKCGADKKKDGKCGGDKKKDGTCGAAK